MNEMQNTEDQIRQQLEQLIESARAEIEQVIAAAERAQHEGEGSDHIDHLKSQLSSLDAQSSQIQRGSMAQLQQMQTTLPRTVNSIRQSSHAIAQSANFEIGQHVVEMTLDKIHALQNKHDAQSADFMNYEAKSANRIDQLSQANGIDVSGYQDNRQRLQADIEEAKRNNDRSAQFNAEAQLAANNTYGLIKAGGSELEIEEAKTKQAEARSRYLKEKEIEALNAGKSQGLTGDALRDHVNEQHGIAANELDIENAKNAKKVGLTPEQQAQAGLTNTEEQSNFEMNENARAENGSIKTAETAVVNALNRDAGFNVLLAASDLGTLSGNLDCAEATCEDHSHPSHVKDVSTQEQGQQTER